MGGDWAPAAIIEGAKRAAAEIGVPVVLVGRPDEIDAAGGPGDLRVFPASEVIAMDADPGRSVRSMKDSSLVRAAEAVRDGKAAAMVSAGNTGAAMAAALLRMGRIKGVARPAIATPIPVPGSDSFTLLLDCGANADCQPEWLVQFAQMGSVLVRERYGIDCPRVGLLSIGEEDTKGNALTKAAHGLLRQRHLPDAEFIGNVEGRDVMTHDVDVVVADGFTGNIVLKTLEGGMKAVFDVLTEALDPVPGEDIGDQLVPRLWGQLDPNTYGGAMLLGVDGVCIISHGSSNAAAIFNACRVAADMVDHEVVAKLRAAVA